MYFVDKPGRPHLSVSKVNVVDGDQLTLTCDANNSLVNNYKFYINYSPVGQSKTGSYIVKQASFDNAGSYNCKSLIDDISSLNSNSKFVSGKYKP